MADMTVVVARTFWELNLETDCSRRAASEPDLDPARFEELECFKDDASCNASCDTSAGSDDETAASSAMLSVISWESEDECTLTLADPAPAEDTKRRRRRGCRAGARGAAPKRKQEVAEEMQTSVLVANISRSVSREDLLALLGQHGLQQACDFLYLPVDFRDGLPCGYAFLNFVSNSWAQAAMQQLSGQVALTEGAEGLELAWTKGNQGLDALVNRYRNSPVMQDDMPEAWRPMLFHQGCRLPFPAPTKKVKSVRLEPKTA